MTTTRSDHDAAGGFGDTVSRRNFCNGVAAGAGALLLGGQGVAARAIDSNEDAKSWDGPGGVGDYRNSNGNSWRTVMSGHAIRDGAHDASPTIIDDGERYDLVIVGGGFAGLGALHAFHRERPAGSCLLLDNQEIFGGYAKANEFIVDGHAIAGAQASLNFVLPKSLEDRGADIWGALGLPSEFRFADREDSRGAIGFAPSSSGPLYVGEQSASTGYYFGKDGWVSDMWRDDLARAPWPEPMKRALLSLRQQRRKGPPTEAEAARLDQMTFADFATRELAATPEALKYITQGMCITGPQISAYGARALPGLERHAPDSAAAEFASRFMSFPTGNTVIARALVRSVLPDAFTGTSAGDGFGRLIPAALDRPGSPRRIRSRATVTKVRNRTDGVVEVIYERDGRLRRLTADNVVLAVGAWIAKRIVADLPEEHREALDRYHYSPILMASVALRNWRFLDKLGFSAARWFDGPGFYCNIRRPMLWDGIRPAPFHPDKPIVMTLYAPFPRAHLPLEAQGPDARAELYGKSFAEYERAIATQLETMFGTAGFDCRRDVAGIVLNRWGHAFVTPPPGFFFAARGQTAPVDVAERPIGRIALGQNGLEDWAGAVAAGRRAAERLLASS